MRKLQSIRDHLLTGPLGIKADKLLTFAERGGVTSYRGDPSRNDDFAIDYTAHIIVTDHAGDPLSLLFVVSAWMKINCPSAPTDAIKFHVDVIDHKAVDVSLMFELHETVRAATLPDGGIRLTSDPDPDVLSIDVASFLSGSS